MELISQGNIAVGRRISKGTIAFGLIVMALLMCWFFYYLRELVCRFYLSLRYSRYVKTGKTIQGVEGDSNILEFRTGNFRVFPSKNHPLISSYMTRGVESEQFHRKRR